MEIKLYEDRYRDDMIFMVLQAKDALGRIPERTGYRTVTAVTSGFRRIGIEQVH